MIYITRRHSIDAGHRVYMHEGKCANLHGHTYKFELTLKSRDGELDKLGRVLDFARLKHLLCGWLDKNWDHKTLLYMNDPLYSELRNMHPIVCHDPRSIVSLPVNPTAENIAKYFMCDIAPGLLLDEHVDLVKCAVWETDNCCATYVLDDFVIEERIEKDAAHTAGSK